MKIRWWIHRLEYFPSFKTHFNIQIGLSGHRESKNYLNYIPKILKEFKNHEYFDKISIKMLKSNISLILTPYHHDWYDNGMYITHKFIHSFKKNFIRNLWAWWGKYCHHVYDYPSFRLYICYYLVQNNTKENKNRLQVL